MEIIPAILENSWSEVAQKIKLIEDASDWIQLDISDGLFTPNKTWSDPQDLFLLKSNVKIEVHLMVNEPWLKAEAWFSSPAKRIVVQVESFSSPESVKFSEIAFKARKYGKDVVWGFKIETPWEPYKELMQLPHARVLFLSVEPGYQGGEFNSLILEKIKFLQAAHSHVKIEVDGGINLSNIESLKSAGADSACVGSAIFGSSDPTQALVELKNAA